MKLMPDVIDKTLKKKEFHPDLIYASLMKETSLSEKEAEKVTLDVVRCVVAISGNVTYITAPMIREISNTVMLKHGFEKQRLEYTRIGFPMYDLNKLFEEKNKKWTDEKILEHVKTECDNVKKLIKAVEEKRVDYIFD